jgi:membrane fusion protein, multidrug efflux system
MINNSVPTTIEPETSVQHQAPKSSRVTKHFVRWLLVLLLLVGLAYWQIGRSQTKKPSGARHPSQIPPVPVLVAAAHVGDISLYLNALGTVTAFNTVTVKSRVDGQLVRVAFREGQSVQAGDLLAEIDPRPFQVQLAQAEGQLAHDEALLNNAKVDLERYRDLFAKDSIPKQQLDTQVAAVAQYQGAIQSDQAQVDNARLQLTYCRITAPLSGRIGLRLVDAGNMIRATDSNGLLVITQVQPIAVLFTIPEDNLPVVLKRMRGGARLSVEVYDRSGSSKIATGFLLTVDNQIDPTTGTSRLKAVFENSNGALFPNQFVNVRLLVEVQRSKTQVPQAAIQRSPQGTFVYVVTPSNVVEVRPVHLGTTEGNTVAVESGLSAGDRVVVDGMDKLRAGSLVRVTSGTGPAG